MLKILVLFLIAAAFAINLFFVLRFLKDYWNSEDRKIQAWILLNILALAMIAIEYFLPMRGGYDSGLCFGIARESFLSMNTTYKEFSPILIYSITDFFSARSIYAILFQNMALSLLSALLIFACLRSLKTGILSAFAGTVFFALNFNNLISASSMASTQCNLFFFISAIIAATFIFREDNAKYANGLIWLFSSVVLVITSRAELATIPVMILIGGILSKERMSGIVDIFKRREKIIILAGILIWAACSVFVLSGEGFRNRFQPYSPYTNAVFQLISNNIAMLFGDKPAIFSPTLHISHHLMFFEVLICVLYGCYLFSNRKKNAVISATFLIATIYISFMYAPKDAYPLHFVRQRAYMLIPLTFLMAFSADGYRRIIGNRKIRIAAMFVLILSYSVLNARTAISLNSEQRSDDRIWQFMAKTQKHIRGRYDKQKINGEWETSVIGAIDKYFFPKQLNRTRIVFITPEYFLLDPEGKQEFYAKYKPLITERIIYRPYFLPDRNKYDGKETEFGFYIPK